MQVLHAWLYAQGLLKELQKIVLETVNFEKRMPSEDDFGRQAWIGIDAYAV